MEMKIEGTKLTIVADLGKGTPSKSGKSTILATTSGFTTVAGTGIKVSLNVIK